MPAPGACWGLPHLKQLVFHLISEMLPDPSLDLTSSANMKHPAHYLAFVFTSLCIYDTWLYFPGHYL